MERAAYGFGHPVGVSENIIVPEPQDPEALGLQPSGTGLIFVGLKSMMAAIEFDDQFRRETNNEKHMSWMASQTAARQPACSPASWTGFF